MSRKVLIVDDSGLARRRARAILESGGYDVIEAEDGMAAIESYFVEKPDIVLLDLVMKGMYGLEVLDRLRQMDPKARVIVVSPPIYSRFFRGKTAYAMGKVGMSVLTKGLAMDWEREGKKDMAITSIWPAAAIQSAATQNVQADDLKDLRKPTIFSDAILAMLRSEAKEVNGALELDEDFLRSKGYKDEDFEKYSLVPGAKPRRIMPMELPDLRVAEQDDEGNRVDSTKLRVPKL